MAALCFKGESWPHLYTAQSGEMQPLFSLQNPLRENSSLGFQKQAVNHLGKKWVHLTPIFDQWLSKLSERLRGRERHKSSQAACMQHCSMLKIS